MKRNFLLVGAKGKYNAVKYEMSKDLEIDISSLMGGRNELSGILEADKDMLEKLKELYEK